MGALKRGMLIDEYHNEEFPYILDGNVRIFVDPAVYDYDDCPEFQCGDCQGCGNQDCNLK